MDSFPPLMRSCGAILGIIEQSTRSQNAAHFNKNGAVWSHFVSHSLVHTILLVETRETNIWQSMDGSLQTENFKRKGWKGKEVQNQSHKIRPLKRMRHWYSTNVYFCVPTLREGIRLGTAHSFFAKLRWFLLLRRNSMIWVMVNLQALGLIFIFPGQIFIIVGCRHENPVIHYGASLSAATSPACSYIPIHIDQFCINIAPSPLGPDHPQCEHHHKN